MCHKHTIYYISLTLAFLSAIFFLIGASGFSDEQDTVETIPWGRGDVDGLADGDFYVGLSYFTIDTIGDFHLTYDDEDCDYDFCETCEDAGTSIVAMCVFALIFSLAALGFNVMTILGDKVIIGKIAATATSLVAAILAIVSFTVFRPCLSSFVDWAADVSFGDATGTYGAAGYLTLVGFIFMIMAAALNGVSICLHVRNTAEEEEEEEEEEGVNEVEEAHVDDAEEEEIEHHDELQLEVADTPDAAL